MLPWNPFFAWNGITHADVACEQGLKLCLVDAKRMVNFYLNVHCMYFKKLL